MADDDLEDLEIVEDAIVTLIPGVQLSKVTNGGAVISHLENLADDDLPQLIILDYNMPQMSGLQVLSKMSEIRRYSSIPKIILSTSGSPKDMRECKERGAMEYYVKPNTIAELNGLVRKMIRLCGITL